MKCARALALATALVLAGDSLRLEADRQPIFEGKVESDANFAVSAQSDKPARPPGYRSAWDDCGGVGASVMADGVGEGVRETQA